MLTKLLKDVFDFHKKDKITILYDTPKKDNPEWRQRRKIASLWYKILSKYKVKLAHYNATYSNNADLPKTCTLDTKEISFDELFSKTDIVIALTEFSATAPLHYFAKRYKLKIASMPGFTKEMIPALDIDYRDVALKVGILYDLLTKSEFAKIIFLVNNKEYKLIVDLRHRKPLKDDGSCRKGNVINLPSGEAFISPFDAKDSKTKGYLPIEDNGIIIYKVANNNIIEGNSILMKKIKEDPAVGNIAELAFGVLGLYGIKSSGKTLLDEKLGVHIALGRNDHFGGLIGPDAFKYKENVWHQDFVYIRELQPNISIKELKLDKEIIIRNGKYVII